MSAGGGGFPATTGRRVMLHVFTKTSSTSSSSHQCNNNNTKSFLSLFYYCNTTKGTIATTSRSFATNTGAKRGGVGGYRKKRQTTKPKGGASSNKETTATAVSSTTSNTATTATEATANTATSTTKEHAANRLRYIWDCYLSPVRFVPQENQPGQLAAVAAATGSGRSSKSPPPLTKTTKLLLRRRPFTRQEFQAWAWRFPLALAAFGFCFVWDETSPFFTLIRLHGPSMLPTMAADQTEIWAIAPMQSIWRYFLFPPKYRHNDLVGFVVPRPKSKDDSSDDKSNNSNDHSARISCKRIVGLPGDTVRRYGTFVHLYVPQDPIGWGILWPSSLSLSETEDASSDWERQSRWRPDRDPKDTIIVPEGHVWVEADCPGLGLDSRQLGPIPMSAIRGRVMGRFWPLWRSKLEDPLYTKDISQRPHPIALDEETLRLYNVHRLQPTS